MIILLDSPEHKVELYEALVEVVDTSLQGEGKLHQLHQVLVLVAVLLPGDDGDEDDDNDKGKVHQLHQVLIFMAVNRFHIQVHTSFGLLSFSFEKLGMKRTNIKNTYFQINTNILATNIRYGLPYKGVETRGSHECRSDSLDFLHIAKLGLAQEIKLGNDQIF